MAVCDEYIAQYAMYPYALDVDCFQSLMEAFHSRYSFYPQYPVADVDYGNFNNYLYCHEKGMAKYMKLPMYKKESKDEKYRDNPYRTVNFPVDRNRDLICPNEKRFQFLRTTLIKGNQYRQTEEFYQCEDCEGCTHREQCHKSRSNRTIRLNKELTGLHAEVLNNLNSIHGAYLRMNRSIQAEDTWGTFGSVKWNCGYNRLCRKCTKGVILKLGLISCGFNLHKYYLKTLAAAKAV